MVEKSETPRINIFECCGCGLCAIALPDVFRLTPEGKAEAYSPENGKKEDIQKVIDDCPIMCIHWEKNS